MEKESLGELDISMFDIPANSTRGTGIPDIGIGQEEMKDLLAYFEGKTERPKFLDAFMSSASDRVAEFSYIAIALQLSRLPSLISMVNDINRELYSAGNIASMDIEDLSKASKNMSAEISAIQESSRRQLETLQKITPQTGTYKELLDTLVTFSPTEIKKMQEYIQNNEEIIN